MFHLGLWPGAIVWIVILSILTFLASAAVVLRIYARYLTGVRLQISDWLVVATLILEYGTTIVIFSSFVRYGLGWSVDKLDAYDQIAILKGTYTVAAIYAASSFAIRYSVILLYLQLFPTTVTRRTCYVLGAICIGWFIASEAATLAICIPVEAFWNYGISGRCIDGKAATIFQAFPGFLIDVVSVALPIYEVSQLNMDKTRKRIVMGIFLVGGLATTASLARLVAVVLVEVHPEFATPPIIILLWSALDIEIYVALIGSCLPIMGPVYHKITGQAITEYAHETPILPDGGTRAGGRKSRLSERISRTLKSNPRETQADENDARFQKLSDYDTSVLVPAKERTERSTYITSSKGFSKANSSETDLIPLEGILVQRDVKWE
ncbi:hypothetical protein GGR57DRAFT_226761 [Xylariaceae sp. FL1272]|nr:hypothetical protein GGR57DRAFT_226761 [Xylariaceae sp. FL1272]